MFFDVEDQSGAPLNEAASAEAGEAACDRKHQG